MAYNRSIFPEGGLDQPIEMFDISPTDKPDIDEYFILCTLTNPSQIQSDRMAYLLTTYNNKILNAEKINYFMDIAINTEKFWFDNVNNYLKFITNYDILYPYKIYNTVMDINGDLYMSLSSNNTGNPLSDATKWRKISQRGLQGEQGEKGNPGIGLAFLGSYDPSATYTINQGVEYNGSLYACTSTTSTGISPSDNTSWSMAVSKGSSTFLTVLRNSVIVNTNTAIIPIGIAGFNKNNDQIFAYKDNDYIEQNQEYTLNSDGLSIVKEVSTWDGTITPINFNFVVFKNVVQGVALSDGSLIQIQSITLDKLNLDIQNKINKIGDAFLQTTAQDLSGAVNENTNNLIAHLANYVRQPAYINPTGGTSTAYTGSTTPALTVYAEGVGVTIIPHVDCGVSPTFNWGALGAVPLLKQDGTAYGALEMLAGKPYSFKRVGTSFLADSSGAFIVTGQTEETIEFSETISIYDPIYIAYSDTLAKLANPTILPPATGDGVAFSADSVYMAVTHYVTPYVTIYKRSGDVFTKLANPAILPTGTGYDVAFSPDGVYMAVASNSTPYVTIYKRAGDVFTKLANPAILPTGTGYGVVFSPDGVYMTVVHDMSPYVTIYKRDGDVFTKLANPATLPTGIGKSVAFSADGVYMTVGQDTSPYVTIYKRAGDVFTKLANPAILPTGTGWAVAFSPDGVYMAVVSNIIPYITIYKRSGDVFTKLPDLATPVGGDGVAFSPDGAYMAVAHGTTPFITIYKREGDVFTKLANPATLPAGMGYDVAFSPDGAYMAVAHGTTPFVTIYTYTFKAFKSKVNEDWFLGIRLGYAKESGIASDLKKVIITHK